jgi:transposase-like protein
MCRFDFAKVGEGAYRLTMAVYCPRCGEPCPVLKFETPKRKFVFQRYFADCKACKITFRVDIHEEKE